MEHAVRMTGRLDPRSSWKADGCTIAKTLDTITTRSAFLILREAFYGTTRFDDFAQRAELSEPVTATRLKELVEHGLLEREDYREPNRDDRASNRVELLQRHRDRVRPSAASCRTVFRRRACPTSRDRHGLRRVGG